MTEAHVRSNLIGAAKWILSGQYAVDIADELIRLGIVNIASQVEPVNIESQIFFSSNEILALQGSPRGDGSWVCEANESIIAEPVRASLFMEYTHQYATIMCSMLDKGALSTPECNWEYKGEGLCYDFGRNELNAFKGDLLPSGDWRDSLPARGTEIISIKAATEFMRKTQFASTIMCLMLEKLNELGAHPANSQDPKKQWMGHNVPNSSSASRSERTLVFETSRAVEPVGINLAGNNYQLLLSCLSAQTSGIQSFFGDFSLTESTTDGVALSDDVLNFQPFDEDLYCRIIKDNHRYKLAELAAQQEEIASQYMAYGGMAGALLGMITHNPILPFAGMSMGRSLAPRTLQEMLPDPYLMFRQDKRSYSSIIAGGTPSARLRRIIFHPQASRSGIFFRTLPAFVTQESVMPMQLFSFNDTNFYRPIAAGIEASQPNYNAAKLWRNYYHLRGDGASIDTGFKLNVVGAEIDNHKYKLYKFKSESRDLEYLYIDYQTEPSHVF